MYQNTIKQKVISYLKNHTVLETCKRFDLFPDTIKYWVDEEFKHKTQEKERRKYVPVNGVKRKYTKGNAEAQRIDAQIKRAINKVPRISYSDVEIEMELSNIQSKKGSLEVPSFNNKTVLTYQQHFYDRERELFNNPKIARKLIKNRQKYLEKEPKYLTPQEILRGFKISGEHYGYSHFAPEWFKWFIEKTQTTSILDPCGGWGHRLVGTIGANIEQYIYNDFDPITAEGCKKLHNKWNKFFQHKVLFYSERAEQLDVSSLSYDSIFTCPPYFSKEIYNNKSFKDIEDFKNWWASVINNVVKKEVNHIGIVIDNQNVDIISEPILNKGYKTVSVEQIKSKKSHFTTGNNKEVLISFSSC